MDYIKILSDSFNVLAKAGIILLLYHGTKNVISYDEKYDIKTYLVAILITAVLSLIAWSGYGVKEENCWNAGYGERECEVISYYDFAENEKNEYGLTIFLILLVPILAGVTAGIQKSKKAK